MTIDEGRLDELMERLEKARAWSPRVVSRLENLLRTGDDHAVFRMNPIAVATARGIDEAESIDLFLHGAKIGLFVMDWHLLCPACAEVVESFTLLREVQSSYRCQLCHTDYPTTLDDYIEVTFTVSPTVRRIRYHDPEQLEAEDYFLNYRHSHGGRLDDGRMVIEHLREAGRQGIMSILAPGAKLDTTLDLKPGFLTGYTPDQRGQLLIEIAGAPRDGQEVHLALEGNRISQSTTTVAPGPSRVRVENRTGERVPLFVAWCPVHPSATGIRVFLPYLSGRRLVNTQTFRDLFRAESVAGDQGLAVRDLTLLFSDLKGSTALYERIGDLKAFALVQQHFDRIGKVVREHRGAIVKTIGDAVMASFESGRDALAAALHMLSEIDRFNREHGARDLVLKIGLHRGSSIAVTLNDRLDYFGQTVNIAARVQGVADADEICITEEVLRAPGAADLVGDLSMQTEDARLKGIQKEVKLHRIRPGAA